MVKFHSTDWAEKYFSAQSARSSSSSVAFLHDAVFFIDRPSSCMARTTGRLSWRVIEKKLINEAEEIAGFNMGARNQYSSINFLGGFIESISYIFIAIAGATQLYRPNVGTIG